MVRANIILKLMFPVGMLKLLMMKKKLTKLLFAESFILFPHHAEMNEGR